METSLNFVPPLPGQRDSSTSAANSLASGKPEDLTSVQEMVFLISLERNKRSRGRAGPEQPRADFLSSRLMALCNHSGRG